MKYCVDMPYPEVKIEHEDTSLAKKIFNVYAGEVSEDSSTHRYILQMLLFNENKEIKEILKGIAIVEMHHLELLGTLIKKLGYVPLYLSVKEDKIKWFSGKYITYENDLKEAILHNIFLEKEAIKNYEDILKITKDPNIIHLIKRIILDERLHIEIFEKIYEQC